MPLLPSILAELDTELDRLHALRRLVLQLKHTPAIVSRYTEPASSAKQAAKPAAAPAVPTPRKPRSDAGKPRGARKPKPQVETTALARAVPKGPVVFSPAQLAQERAQRSLPKALPTPEAGTPEPADLDALSRDLAKSWSAVAVQ